jgi:hypothetical protein
MIIDKPNTSKNGALLGNRFEVGRESRFGIVRSRTKGHRVCFDRVDFCS